ncbi:MAG: hypothetical protein AVDCRST_MAG93-7481 [uncultured Chloroflexia bacterium]|uniref:Uncharacterized protein n=1 Tax=uncultured Chloroflexia bacterium TaxID=1672391 RepID=A0A6J4MFM7_9CHLR|nr:MAG: hypothetical protein AVDCRST_MAG93-7481 [uncultured Chloroflexia bacterium]
MPGVLAVISVGVSGISGAVKRSQYEASILHANHFSRLIMTS